MARRRRPSTDSERVTDYTHEEAKRKNNPEVGLSEYDRALARIKADNAWVAEERKRLLGELAQAQRREGVALGLREARERLLGHLERGSTADWREVFTALAVGLSVKEDGTVEVALAIPTRQTPIVSNAPPGVSPPHPPLF